MSGPDGVWNLEYVECSAEPHCHNRASNPRPLRHTTYPPTFLFPASCHSATAILRFLAIATFYFRTFPVHFSATRFLSRKPPVIERRNSATPCRGPVMLSPLRKRKCNQQHAN